MTEAPAGQTGGLERRDLIRLAGLLAVLGVITAVVVLLGGGGGGSSASQRETVQGIITDVDETKLVLAVDGGGTRTFVIRPEDLRALDLFHLRQHSAQQLESIVFFETEDGADNVVRVDDAPTAGP